MAADGRFDPSIAGCAIAEQQGQVNLARTAGAALSAAASAPTYQQTGPSLCVRASILIFLHPMNADRIARAMERIETAMERIGRVRDTLPGTSSAAEAAAPRVAELVNSHERLREQVAESLRELDDLLAKLED
jgi:hypothetical protein